MKQNKKHAVTHIYSTAAVATKKFEYYLVDLYSFNFFFPFFFILYFPLCQYKWKTFSRYFFTIVIFMKKKNPIFFLSSSYPINFE